MNKILELDNSNFDIIIKSNIPVLVEFWSLGCRPCRLMKPVLQQLVDEFDETEAIIAKCDATANAVIASRYNVDTVPNVIIFQKGKVKHVLNGLQQFSKLKFVLSELVS